MHLKIKPLTLAVLLVVAPLLAIALAVVVAVWLFEAHDVEQGSIQYVLGVPGSVRAVAHTVEACSPPRWQWKGRDGESAPYIALHYGSTATRGEVLRQHTASLAALSCHADGGLDRGGSVRQQSLRCTHPDVAKVDIDFSDEATGNEARCRAISLTFLETY
jgi:hypothetical protein